MKRMICLLSLCMLLWGCAAQPAGESTAWIPETEPTREMSTEPAGIYEPFSDLEIRTDGAIRCYQPEHEDTYGLRIINGDVLLFSGANRTTLSRYTGDRLRPVGQTTLDFRVEPDAPSFQITEHGITCYDSRSNTLVYLDNDLKEVRRLELAPDLVGEPVLSSDRTRIFYCTADAVRVLDMDTGLDRLLKSISYPIQTVADVLMHDSLLRCDMTDDQGRDYVIFLSTESGRLQKELFYRPELVAEDDFYCTLVTEGLLTQALVGWEDNAIQALYPLDPFAESWILEKNRALVTVSREAGATTLTGYDLVTGLRTSEVTVSGVIRPQSMESVPGTDGVCILARDGEAEAAVVLIWDCGATAVQDETVYTGPRYTAKAPDEAGLARCADKAREIGARYGLNILVGPEAAAAQPEDYTLEQEYQISILQRELAELEDLLTLFPEGFFRSLHGQTSICILRSVTGNPASGTVERARGIQFWDGEKAYVALEAGESFRQTFFHEIFHIIDGKVLSTTRVYYHWENLNPEGCRYFEDFTSYLTADVGQYLEGENRAFIDAYSMCYPREDRARIMEYACMPGNEEYFQSEIMQNKLKTLCEGIRRAFGLEKYEQPLLWEQYLTEPLD